MTLERRLMAEQSADGNAAVALLGNTIPTGAILVVLITIFGLYITAAYWFTSSTSLANPAVTIARGFSDTFAGIAPVDVTAFIGVQMIAAVLAKWFLGLLLVEAENG